MKNKLLFIACILTFSLHVSANSTLKTEIKKNSNFQFETGQLALTESDQPVNIIFLLVADIFTPFMHGGIISVEDDGVFVYESRGTYHLSLTKPPTDTVKGKVTKTPWEDFLKNQKTVSIFSPPTNINISKTIAYLKKEHQKKTSFDAYFDYSQDDSLYCSELMAKSLEAGGSPPFKLTKYRDIPAITALRKWLKLKGETILPLGTMVQPKQWLATYSLTHTEQQLYGIRATKYEIYKRFNQQQKLGNIIKWQLLDISYQDEVIKLFDKVSHAITSSNIEYTPNSVVELVEKEALKLYGQSSSKETYDCSNSLIVCKKQYK